MPRQTTLTFISSGSNVTVSSTSRTSSKPPPASSVRCRKQRGRMPGRRPRIAVCCGCAPTISKGSSPFRWSSRCCGGADWKYAQSKSSGKKGQRVLSQRASYVPSLDQRSFQPVAIGAKQIGSGVSVGAVMPLPGSSRFGSATGGVPSAPFAAPVCPAPTGFFSKRGPPKARSQVSGIFLKGAGSVIPFATSPGFQRRSPSTWTVRSKRLAPLPKRNVTRPAGPAPPGGYACPTSMTSALGLKIAKSDG